MRRLRDFVKKVNWQQGLAVWEKFFSFEHPIQSCPDIIPETLGDVILSVRTPKSDGKRKKKNKGRGTKKISVDQETKEEVEAITPEVYDDGGVVHGEAPECTNDNTIDDDKTTCNPETNMDASLGSRESSKSEETEEKSEKLWDPLKPSFRVTCYRAGEGHCFDSMTAAANFGGAVNDFFGWNVKMTNYDIEVVLSVDDTEVAVGLALTKQSLHRRNIVSFGPTTLRPTIAFSMLR